MHNSKNYTKTPKKDFPGWLAAEFGIALANEAEPFGAPGPDFAVGH